MVEIEKIIGRLGNKMFMFSAVYALARDNRTDFYFQDPKWFEKYSEEIKAIFQEGIKTIPFVSIHVRRGKNPVVPNEPPYSQNPFYTHLCDTDYYQKAISLFPGEKFFVFSDDLEWCKKKFKGNRFTFFKGKDEIEDFNTMASCESNIIANSSYSWWAAYLNPNSSKRVICPPEDRWYADGEIRTKVPIDWTQLSFK